MKLFDDAEYLLVAAVGGVIGFAMRGKSPKSVKSYLFAAFSAGFVGYITLKMCRYGGASEDLIGAISGLAGWLGAESTLPILQRYTLEKLGLTVDKDKAEDTSTKEGDKNGDRPQP